MPPVDDTPAHSSLDAIGLRLSDWFERWFPDAFALALLAVALVFVATLATGRSVVQSAQWFGAGFWDLVAFTMQMSMIIVTGYAVATSAPVYAVIRWMAAVPTTGRGAAAYVGLFSMLASLLDAIEGISGVIPLSQTLGLWQSLLIAGLLIVVSMLVSYYSAPPAAQARG